MRISQRRRCAAEGLRMGDCEEQPTDNSVYCYYHDKLQTGAITTLYEGNTDNWREVSPLVQYPVWPLPKKGFAGRLKARAA